VKSSYVASAILSVALLGGILAEGGVAQEAKATGEPVEKPTGQQFVDNSIGIRLVLIPAGEFSMGGESAGELARFFENRGKPPATFFAGERPKHLVRITKPFYLAKYEVTVGQFRQFMADSSYKTDAEKDGKGGFGYDGKSFTQKPEFTWRNAGFAQTDEHPVVNVSWNDAVAFCDWLSRKEGNTYRLPTEAEWERACRAGTQSYWYHDNYAETLAQVGNVPDASAKARFPDWPTIAASDGCVFTAPVGRFRPNAFGLYDMHGNVWEWCADWYDSSYYYVHSYAGQWGKTVDDPIGPASGRFHVLRGGSFYLWPLDTRSSSRVGGRPDRRFDIGFRVARTL